MLDANYGNLSDGNRVNNMNLILNRLPHPKGTKLGLSWRIFEATRCLV